MNTPTYSAISRATRLTCFHFPNLQTVDENAKIESGVRLIDINNAHTFR